MIVNDGGIYTDDVYVDNYGLVIRNGTTFTQVAAFRSDQVLLPSAGLTFSDATTQTTAGISAATAASTYYPLTGNPSGFLTSVPAPTVNTVSSFPYTLVIGDANNIVYLLGQNYVTVYIPTDATVNFPIGTTVRLVLNNCSYITVSPADYGMSGPAINNATTNSVTFLQSSPGAYVANLVKVAADSWVVA